MKQKNKKKFKFWLGLTAIVLSVVASVSAIIGIHNMQTTETLNNTDYMIASIDETGKIIESKKNLISENLETIDGYSIDIDEETATITYKVVFYDEDQKYLSMTESLNEDFDTTTTPETAKYFRVIITPYQVDGEDVQLNIFNMSKYSSQLDVEFDK